MRPPFRLNPVAVAVHILFRTQGQPWMVEYFLAGAPRET
jgi:hypothetical protein